MYIVARFFYNGICDPHDRPLLKLSDHTKQWNKRLFLLHRVDPDGRELRGTHRESRSSVCQETTRIGENYWVEYYKNHRMTPAATQPAAGRWRVRPTWHAAAVDGNAVGHKSASGGGALLVAASKLNSSCRLPAQTGQKLFRFDVVTRSVSGKSSFGQLLSMASASAGF